jgi:hypothetical protein
VDAPVSATVPELRQFDNSRARRHGQMHKLHLEGRRSRGCAHA